MVAQFIYLCVYNRCPTLLRKQKTPDFIRKEKKCNASNVQSFPIKITFRLL